MNFDMDDLDAVAAEAAAEAEARATEEQSAEDVPLTEVPAGVDRAEAAELRAYAEEQSKLLERNKGLLEGAKQELKLLRARNSKLKQEVDLVNQQLVLAHDKIKDLRRQGGVSQDEAYEMAVWLAGACLTSVGHPLKDAEEIVFRAAKHLGMAAEEETCQ